MQSSGALRREDANASPARGGVAGDLRRNRTVVSGVGLIIPISRGANMAEPGDAISQAVA